MYLRVKNWTEFQHYKDRNPPWIKLHRTLLDDYEFSCLQDASKAHLMLIWLFASQKNGLIPDDPAFLKRKLGLEKEPNLKLLISHGLLIPEQSASKALADCEQLAPREEKRREETERFAHFWETYPKKAAKPDALKAFLKLSPDGELFAKMLGALELSKRCAEWQQEGGKFIPHPATWINGRRWEDEAVAAQPTGEVI